MTPGKYRQFCGFCGKGFPSRKLRTQHAKDCVENEEVAYQNYHTPALLKQNRKVKHA